MAAALRLAVRGWRCLKIISRLTAVFSFPTPCALICAPIASRRERCSAQADCYSSATLLNWAAASKMGIGKIAKSYLFWTYNRGSMHYDVMVTLILAFIFITPYYVNFKDKPTAHTTHPNQIIITSDGQNGFIYEISADQLAQGPDLQA